MIWPNFTALRALLHLQNQRQTLVDAKNTFKMAVTTLPVASKTWKMPEMDAQWSI